MKILLLNHTAVNFGTYFRVLLLARYLKKNNPDFTIKMLTLNDKTSFFVKKLSIEGVDLYLIPVIEHTKVKFKILTVLFFLLNTLMRLFYYFFFALFTDYDILHSFTLAQPHIALTVKITWHLRKDKKIVIDWDDLWTGSLSKFFPETIQKIMRHFEYGYLRYGNCYTCNSRFLQRELFKHGIQEEKIVLLPNGCNTDQVYPIDQNDAREKLGLPRKEKILLIVGNTHDYNIFLFNALNEVLQNDTYLYVVGLKQESRLEKNIIYAGIQPHDTMKYWLSAADILLLPMSDDKFNEARFPLRFGDYLCAGKPIVSNAFGDVRYYIEKFKCGLVSDVNDPKSFRENTLKLIKTESLGKELGLNGLKLAKGELNWKNLAAKMEKTYKKLVSE